MTATDTQATNIRLARSLIADVDRIADQRRWSRNKMIGYVLELYVARQNKATTVRENDGRTPTKDSASNGYHQPTTGHNRG